MMFGFSKGSRVGGLNLFGMLKLVAAAGWMLEPVDLESVNRQVQGQAGPPPKHQATPDSLAEGRARLAQETGDDSAVQLFQLNLTRAVELSGSSELASLASLAAH